MQCPKCGKDRRPDANECEFCGIVFSKYKKAKKISLEKASKEYKTENFHEARQLFTKHLKQYPEDVNVEKYVEKVTFKEAITAFKSNRLDDAKELFIILQKEFPNRTDEAQKYIKDIEERKLKNSKFSEKAEQPPERQDKQCPFCKESIHKDAVKCKHCGSELEEGGTSTDVKVSKPAADYGVFLLAIPVVGILLIWFWVGNMNLLQSPGSKMALIMIATVLGTALLAAMEANKLGMKTDRKKGTYSPIAWFFIIALIWIIGYPVYLYKRKHFGLTNHLVVGLVVVFVFMISFAVMQNAIEEQRKGLNLGDLQHELPVKPVSMTNFNFEDHIHKSQKT